MSQDKQNDSTTGQPEAFKWISEADLKLRQERIDAIVSDIAGHGCRSCVSAFAFMRSELARADSEIDRWRQCCGKEISDQAQIALHAMDRTDEAVRSRNAWAEKAAELEASIERLKAERETAWDLGNIQYKQERDAALARVKRLEQAAYKIRDGYPLEHRGTYYEDLCEALAAPEMKP